MPRGLGMRREIRRHVRGRRMFYGFNLSRSLRSSRLSILFLFFFIGFFSPRCGIAREEQETAWSFEMIDDGFRRIYGYFVPRRERILFTEREILEQIQILVCPSLRAFLNLRFANESLLVTSKDYG